MTQRGSRTRIRCRFAAETLYQFQDYGRYFRAMATEMQCCHMQAMMKRTGARALSKQIAETVPSIGWVGVLKCCQTAARQRHEVVPEMLVAATIELCRKYKGLM